MAVICNIDYYWDNFLFNQSLNLSLGLTFNKSEVGSSCSQKHLSLLLDERLNFNEHIQRNMNKCLKNMGFIKKLSYHLPHDALLRIFKSFIRPFMDYGDIIWEKPNTESFKT